MLTPTQTRVLELVAAGLTTVDVAARMNLPVPVVQHHLREAIERLGARSKLEAVLLALRYGLIQLSLSLQVLAIVLAA